MKIITMLIASLIFLTPSLFVIPDFLSVFYFWHPLPFCVVSSKCLSILQLRFFKYVFSREAESS